ncbi:MAG: aromatic ring-hydroxylating dioxygenase subunit alpha [Alphaproteobacteria bacterium]
MFFASWQYVCHVNDVADAGSYVTASILDQDVFVIRDKAGPLRAFYNVCRHRAHRLLNGSGRAPVITCPYHAWSYRPDGSLRSARATDGVRDFRPDDFSLVPVQLEELHGLVFVNLDPAARPLAEQAGDLVGQMQKLAGDSASLVKAATMEWEIEANWKVVIDNFLECYHCAPAHPDFARLVDLATYKPTTYAIHSMHESDAGRPDNSAYAFDPARHGTRAIFWWLWPTTTFGVVPGPPNLAMFYLRPLGPERTVEVVDYYFPDGPLDQTAKDRIRYANEVLQPEDNRLCENVQRGLRSRGYSQGRFIVNPDRTDISEHAVHHFHSLYMQAMAEVSHDR